MKSVVKNQEMLAKARDEAATAREQQEKAAVQERGAKRELEQTAQSKQHALEVEMEAKQRKIWAAEGLINSANRLTRFIAERNVRSDHPGFPQPQCALAPVREFQSRRHRA